MRIALFMLGMAATLYTVFGKLLINVAISVLITLRAGSEWEPAEM